VRGGSQPGELSDADLLEKFFTQRDQAAFGALLQRHGSMVLGVCRRILRNQADAEDAFQATFLVLVRQVGSIHKRESVGSFLHGVAHRLAHRTRVDAARRQAHEREVLRPAPQAPRAPEHWADVRAIIDDELGRLPEKYRAPLVICYLEGKTYGEAARQLGWPDGTVCGRLARARNMLRTRLARRGLTLAAALGAEALASQKLLAAVPGALVATTVRLAMLLASPEAVGATGLSTSVNVLVEGMMKTMFLRKIKTVVAVVLTLGMLGTGAGLVARQSLSAQPTEANAQGEPQQPGRNAEPPKADDKSARPDASSDPLPLEAAYRLGAIPSRRGYKIGLLRFTPDGQTLVGQGGGSALALHAQMGRILRFYLPGAQGGDGDGADLSPDGLTLATPGEDKICLWEADTGKELRTIGAERCERICFSPDGTHLASQSGTPAVRLDIWDATTGEKIRSWQVPEKASFVSKPVFTKDGTRLITGDRDHAIRFWDVATGKEQKKVDLGSTMPHRLAISPDGSLLAATGLDEKGNPESRIRLIDVAQGKEKLKLSVLESTDRFGHRQGFGEIAFTPDGTLLVAAGIDECLIFFDPATGKEKQRLGNGFTNPGALVVAPDGKTIASVVGSRKIRLADLASGLSLFDISMTPPALHGLDFASDGQTVAIAGGNKTITIWDAGTGKEARRLEGHAGVVTGMSLAVDGNTLVSAAEDKTVRFWDLKTGKELRKFDNLVGLQRGSLAPDGKTLALVAKGSKSIRLVAAANGQETHTLTGLDEWYGAEFTPDGKSLVAWSAAHEFHIWNPSTGEHVRQILIDAPEIQQAGNNKIHYQFVAALSQDGKLLAYGAHQNFVLVLELATGKVLHKLLRLPDRASTIAFSADNKTLAWSGWTDATVHLVELSTGKERHRFVGKAGRILSLAFGADGRSLISGNEDTTATIWDLTGQKREGQSWSKPLGGADLDGAWDTLAGDDAAKAFRMGQRLAGSPKDAIAYLQKRLQPVPVVEEKRVQKLIADLGSDDFATRTNATKELEKLEDSPVDLYQMALEGDQSVEARKRLDELVEKSAELWRTLTPERRRVIRALEVLELAGTPEARQVLQSLAKGASGARQTQEAKASLERLQRHKK
jgi:RNA polymerase sigma factor (sigma-70 family)